MRIGTSKYLLAPVEGYYNKRGTYWTRNIELRRQQYIDASEELNG